MIERIKRIICGQLSGLLQSPEVEKHIVIGGEGDYTLNASKYGPPPYTIYLNHVSIREELRGCGIFTSVLDWLERHGAVEKIALVNVTNSRLREFLARRGYNRVGDNDYVCT